MVHTESAFFTRPLRLDTPLFRVSLGLPVTLKIDAQAYSREFRPPCRDGRRCYRDECLRSTEGGGSQVACGSDRYGSQLHTSSFRRRYRNAVQAHPSGGREVRRDPHVLACCRALRGHAALRLPGQRPRRSQLQMGRLRQRSTSSRGGRVEAQIGHHVRSRLGRRLRSWVGERRYLQTEPKRAGEFHDCSGEALQRQLRESAPGCSTGRSGTSRT